MRKSLALKSLLRSPLKTLLTFLLIAAASFALFSRVTDYAVTMRETESVKSLYHAVASLDNTVPDIPMIVADVYSPDRTRLVSYDTLYKMQDKPWLTEEELITLDAQPENFCIGTIDGEIACGFILQWTDAVYWPNAPEQEAAYLHKFCVLRRFAGRGMTKLVTEAIRSECRRRGIRYIRLDTGLDEKAVRKIYLKAGYKIVDILDYPNGRSMALYEMEVD